MFLFNKLSEVINLVNQCSRIEGSRDIFVFKNYCSAERRMIVIELHD